MTEIEARIEWLKAEEFTIVVTGLGRILFQDEDKERKGEITPFCDVTALWNSTKGVTPAMFAELMMDYASDSFCYLCWKFVEPHEVDTIDQDYAPDLPHQICVDCGFDYVQNKNIDDYEANGVSRSDFI